MKKINNYGIKNFVEATFTKDDVQNEKGFNMYQAGVTGRTFFIHSNHATSLGGIAQAETASRPIAALLNDIPLARKVLAEVASKRNPLLSLDLEERSKQLGSYKLIIASAGEIDEFNEMLSQVDFRAESNVISDDELRTLLKKAIHYINAGAQINIDTAKKMTTALRVDSPLEKIKPMSHVKGEVSFKPYPVATGNVEGKDLDVFGREFFFRSGNKEDIVVMNPNFATNYKRIETNEGISKRGSMVYFEDAHSSAKHNMVAFAASIAGKAASNLQDIYKSDELGLFIKQAEEQLEKGHKVSDNSQQDTVIKKDIDDILKNFSYLNSSIYTVMISEQERARAASQRIDGQMTEEESISIYNENREIEKEIFEGLRALVRNSVYSLFQNEEISFYDLLIIALKAAKHSMVSEPKTTVVDSEEIVLEKQFKSFAKNVLTEEMILLSLYFMSINKYRQALAKGESKEEARKHLISPDNANINSDYVNAYGVRLNSNHFTVGNTVTVKDGVALDDNGTAILVSIGNDNDGEYQVINHKGGYYAVRSVAKTYIEKVKESLSDKRFSLTFSTRIKGFYNEDGEFEANGSNQKDVEKNENLYKYYQEALANTKKVTLFASKKGGYGVVGHTKDGGVFPLGFVQGKESNKSLRFLESFELDVTNAILGFNTNEKGIIVIGGEITENAVDQRTNNFGVFPQLDKAASEGIFSPAYPQGRKEFVDVKVYEGEVSFDTFESYENESQEYFELVGDLLGNQEENNSDEEIIEEESANNADEEVVVILGESSNSSDESSDEGFDMFEDLLAEDELLDEEREDQLLEDFGFDF